MTSDWLPALAAAIGTAAGGAATWIVARRLSSGNIRTSEAETLWEASESIRHDLTAALAAQTIDLVAVKAEFAKVNLELVALREANAGLSAELAALRRHLER